MNYVFIALIAAVAIVAEHYCGKVRIGTSNAFLVGFCSVSVVFVLILITANILSPGSLVEKTVFAYTVIVGGWIVLAVASGYRCYVAQSFVK